MQGDDKKAHRPTWDDLAEPKKPPVRIPLPFDQAVEGLVRVKPEPAKKKVGKREKSEPQ
jgi:hypothetical protein